MTRREYLISGALLFLSVGFVTGIVGAFAFAVARALVEGAQW